MSYEGTDRQTHGRRHTSWPGVAVAVALAAALLPAAASAADYCVAPNTSCGGTHLATLEQALSAAATNPDADRIFLGAATYTAPTSSGYVYSNWMAPVEIIGGGEGQTIVTGQAGGFNGVLQLYGAAGSSIHDLTIRLPQNAAANYGGLWTDNLLRRVAVTEDPAQQNFRYGVRLEDGATVEDSTITLAGEHAVTGVLAGNAPSTAIAIRHSTVSAGTGIESFGANIERSRVTGSEYAIQTVEGKTAVTNSLVRLTGCCTGIRVDEAGSATLNADGVTLLVPVSPNVVGIGVSTSDYASGSASMTVTNSIIRGSNPLFAYATGSGKAKITASYSDYDTSQVATTGANASIAQAHISNVADPRFVNPGAGDYHLRPDSALIDAGDPASAQSLDLDGSPLVVDGNHDGIARRDLGAFEFQPAAPHSGQPAPSGGGQAGGTDTQPPIVSGLRANPGRFTVARAGGVSARLHRGAHLHFTLSENSRVTLIIQRVRPGRRHSGKCVRPSARLRHGARCALYRTAGTVSRAAKQGANTVPFTGRLGRRMLGAGSYRVVVRAVDAAGNQSTPHTTRFRIITG